MTYIKKANKQEFAKVLLIKSFWREICQRFPPPKIHAIKYQVADIKLCSWVDYFYPILEVAGQKEIKTHDEKTYTATITG